MLKTNFKVNHNISINGKNYKSLKEVPEAFKKFTEDKDGNGQPDFVENIVNNANKEMEKNGAKVSFEEMYKPENQNLSSSRIITKNILSVDKIAIFLLGLIIGGAIIYFVK